MIKKESHQDRRINFQTEYTVDHFERRGDPFVALPANTPELKRIFNELRYIVYCEEHPEFEEKSNLDKTETDVYDEHSRSYLLMYKPLHMVIGGVRLILPQLDKEHYFLPALQLENSPFYNNFPYDLSKMGELSRFLIAKRRMKIVRSHQTESCDYPTYTGPLGPLVYSIFMDCKDNKLDGFVSVLSPILLKVARQYGFHMTNHGPLLEYHGARQGAYMIIEDYLGWTKDNNIKNYNYLNVTRSSNEHPNDNMIG